MTIFEITSILITLAAVASYLNHRFVRLPTTIGLMVIALLMSLAFVILGKLGLVEFSHATTFMRSIDFSATLLHGMLAFLLFAGGLHVNLSDLASQKVPVAVLSTVGVIIATFATGLLFWQSMQWLGFDLPFIYALLFGALISPTDPIAVLGILKNAGAPKSLETKITGESLFNDGVGVVIFLTILGIVVSGQQPEPSEIALFLLEETVGGIGLGLSLGWVVYRLLRSVDNYQVEILLTLALAAGGYTLAEAIHVSAPIAIVTAGLLIGNQGRTFAMSEKTREHLDPFWELIDEILNAVLFVLMGLEVLTLALDWNTLAAGLIAIVVVLMARFVSVALPMLVMRLQRQFTRGAIKALTWGGLRGGISIALALSLPLSPHRDLILAVTYIVVVFSVLVQGLTLGRVLRGKNLKPD